MMMIDSTTTYVKVWDPATGTVDFLPLAPAIIPGTEWRFRRPLPPRAPVTTR